MDFDSKHFFFCVFPALVSVCAYVCLCCTGNDASQDERGAAAIFMTQMDDHLGGFARQFTEYQGHESNVFRSYFKHGIIYKVKQRGRMREISL